MQLRHRRLQSSRQLPTMRSPKLRRKIRLNSRDCNRRKKFKQPQRPLPGRSILKPNQNLSPRNDRNRRYPLILLQIQSRLSPSIEVVNQNDRVKQDPHYQPSRSFF